MNDYDPHPFWLDNLPDNAAITRHEGSEDQLRARLIDRDAGRESRGDVDGARDPGGPPAVFAGERALAQREMEGKVFAVLLAAFVTFILLVMSFSSRYVQQIFASELLQTA